ncbi:hypothetical protein ACFXTI_024335 [Malus domestica]
MVWHTHCTITVHAKTRPRPGVNLMGLKPFSSLHHGPHHSTSPDWLGFPLHAATFMVAGFCVAQTHSLHLAPVTTHVFHATCGPLCASLIANLCSWASRHKPTGQLSLDLEPCPLLGQN